MPLDERNSRPLYRQVADELRVQIQQRHLPPGRQLPTEAALMDRYGVSRNTIRLALGVLRTEGLVVTGQGRGSFVADVPVRRARRPGSAFQHSIRQDGGDVLGAEHADVGDGPRVEVTVSTHPAPPHVADRLGLHTGDRVVARHRLLYGDTAPSHSIDTFLAAELVADTDLIRPEPLRVGVAQLLAEIGCTPSRVTDEISVRMPSPIEAQELQIATGVPLVSVQRTVYDDADSPVLTATTLLPGDRHTLRYDVAIELIVDEPPSDD